MFVPHHHPSIGLPNFNIVYFYATEIKLIWGKVIRGNRERANLARRTWKPVDDVMRLEKEIFDFEDCVIRERVRESEIVCL